MKIIIVLLLFLPICINAQVITTVTTTGCYDINGIAFDKYGNLYFTNLLGNQVKKMDTGYVISVIAGTGATGFSGDGGQATNAELDQPVGITVDTGGNVYFTDASNQRVRKIDMHTGIISTIAGTGIGGYGTGGFSGDGGAASTAQLNQPSGICFDKMGNLYIADGYNYRIRKINTSGIITTIAGNGLSGSSGEGVPATTAKCYPTSGILIDGAGNIFFTNYNTTIRKINTTGVISTIAGDTTSNVYNGDGIPATNAQLDGQWLAMGSDSLLYISDEANNARIRVIDNSGIIHTIAGIGINGNTGDGGPATAAEVSPTGLAFDYCGNLIFGETWTADIRKISFNPTCTLASLNAPKTESNDITIFPNPFGESVNISGVKDKTEYVLLNITGIIEQRGTLHAGDNTIQVTALPPGMYLLECMDGEGNETVRKVVKE